MDYGLKYNPIDTISAGAEMGNNIRQARQPNPNQQLQAALGPQSQLGWQLGTQVRPQQNYGQMAMFLQRLFGR